MRPSVFSRWAVSSLGTGVTVGLSCHLSALFMAETPCLLPEPWISLNMIIKRGSQELRLWGHRLFISGELSVESAG